MSLKQTAVSMVLGLVLIAAAGVPNAGALEPDAGFAPVPSGFPPNGLRPLPADQVAQLAVSPPAPALQMPDSLDWRAEGIITPSRSQDHCGACWAFAAIACIEAKAIQAGAPPTLDLSEQFPISCDTLITFIPPNEYRSDGCCGGFVFVFDFLSDNAAIAETHFAWGDGDFDGEGPRACAAEPDWNTIPCPSSWPPHAGWRVTSWNLLPVGLDNLPTVATLKTALQDGPVWLGYYVYEDFYTYWQTADPEEVYQRQTGANTGGHAVLLIGYNDRLNAWLVKNHWGATAGPNDDGTFWVHYTDHNCSFGLNATVVNGVIGGLTEEHACCVGDECFLVSGAECIALGGDWLESVDACDPSPCPTPIKEVSFGTLKDLFREQ